MQFAMVLDVEQIAMRQQVRQADRIATQPEIGDENLVAAMPLSTSAVAIRSSKSPGQASRVKATTRRSDGGSASLMRGSIGMSSTCAVPADVHGRKAGATTKHRRDRQKRHIFERSPTAASPTSGFLMP